MPVYLDNNATTPLDERVLDAMLPFMQGCYGNPSSVHRYGRLVRGAIDQAREQVAALLGAHPSEVIFTASGTEANNLAVKGFAASYTGEQRKMAVGCAEHASLRDPAFALTAQGWQIDDIACATTGVHTPELFEAALVESPALASVMAANNETGVIQPINVLAQIARERNVVFHVDATQAAGKLPVDFASLGAQLMTVSSHKLYGPLGVGALITDKSCTLTPQIAGGGQERGLRSGTENIAAIVGFGKAAALAKSELDMRRDHCLALRRRLEAGLTQYPNVVIFAEQSDRLCNTVQFGLKGFHGETTLMKLDCRGIAVSSGSACHADRVDPSHVLLAMGVDSDTALTAIRATLGKDSSENDVDALIHAVDQIVSSPLHSAAMAANLA